MFAGADDVGSGRLRPAGSQGLQLGAIAGPTLLGRVGLQTDLLLVDFDRRIAVGRTQFTNRRLAPDLGRGLVAQVGDQSAGGRQIVRAAGLQVVVVVALLQIIVDVGL